MLQKAKTAVTVSRKSLKTSAATFGCRWAFCFAFRRTAQHNVAVLSGALDMLLAPVLVTQGVMAGSLFGRNMSF
jgi:hypothetical protein